ncbi:MAG: TrmH family RNA methyltransferase [Candidatus Moraniibacteriota bacterium]
MTQELFLILHNIRSAHNVGALFRSADGAGVREIVLTGYTPLPVKGDKLVLTPAEKSLEKTALGAEKSMAWKNFETLPLGVEYLREKGVEIIALEQSDASVDYRKFRIKKSVALIVGNEVEGLLPEELALADAIIDIPMRGAKESLNVSVAGSIALYELAATIEKPL